MDEKPGFGRTDEELATLPLNFRPDLMRGQVVLISGGGSGIGRALAYWFARLGARVALCGRRIEKLERTAEGLRRLGAEVLVEAASIRNPDDVARLHERVWSRFGTLDVLVNNAGGQFPQPAIDYSVKGWNAVIDTNLNGTWYMMQAAAKRWRDRGEPGSVVNIVSSVERGIPQQAHSCATRAGVIFLSKTLAIEWAPLGIRINCVAPGIIATEGMDVYPEEARRALPRSNLLRRFGDVTDVADAVTYLAGPSGGFMTGEVMVVDGGNQVWGDQWTIPRPAWFDEDASPLNPASARPR